MFPEPSEPLSVVTVATDTTASVSWKAPLAPNGPLTGYKIAFSKADDKNLTWNEVPEDVTNQEFTNLTESTKYTVHVLAYNVDEDTKEELDSPISSADFSTGQSPDREF